MQLMLLQRKCSLRSKTQEVTSADTWTCSTRVGNFSNTWSKTQEVTHATDVAFAT